jgi:WD40 repeat protein
MTAAKLAFVMPLLLLAGGDRPAPAGGGQARTDLHGDPLPPGAVARLGTIRFRHGKGIAALALSPDGRTITSAGGDGSIVLHDATTGEKLRSFEGQPSCVAVALAPDGRTLAAVVGGRRVAVREAATGKRVCDFQVEQEPVRQLAFSSDGRTLAGGGNHRVHVWDVPAGKEVVQITPPGLETLTIALSPDGKILATAGWDRKERPVLCLWETAGGRKLQQWQPVTDMEETHALAFSPDGKRLAAASGYGDGEPRDRLRVWAVPTGERQFDLPGRFVALRYSPCGKILAAVGSDVVSLREADTGKEVRRIPGSGPVNFAVDGKILVRADHHAVITFWDVAAGKKLSRPLPGHDNSVRSVQFLTGGRTLASLGDDALYLWQLRTARSISRFEGEPTRVAWRALSPDGKTLAAVFWDRTAQSTRLGIGLWDTGTGQKLHDLEPPPKSSLTALVFSPDAKTLAVALWDDRTVQFWDVATGKPLRRITLPNVSAESLAFSPDGKTLAVGDGLYLRAPNGKVPAVRLVDAVSGRELRKPLELPETAAARVQSSRVVNMGPVAFSADGTILAAAVHSGGNWGTEHALQVWDVGTGQVQCRLERASNRFALSPDGKSLVTTAGDPNFGETPRLWEVATGNLRTQIRGHLGSVLGADFSPDGRLLATGSQDSTVLIWDVLNLNGEPPAAGRLSPRELEDLWADLAGADAARAYRAIRALAAAADDAVPFLRQRLPPAAVPDPNHLARLLADLGADRFAVREQATRELEKLGPLARPALREVLAGRPSAEVRRRVERLLARPEGFPLSGDELRAWRVIEVLEHLGTADARKMLEGLAGGASGPLRTEGAKAAVRRLAGRGVRP